MKMKINYDDHQFYSRYAILRVVILIEVRQTDTSGLNIFRKR